jgi:hypothetical protein
MERLKKRSAQYFLFEHLQFSKLLIVFVMLFNVRHFSYSALTKEHIFIFHLSEFIYLILLEKIRQCAQDFTICFLKMI